MGEPLTPIRNCGGYGFINSYTFLTEYAVGSSEADVHEFRVSGCKLESRQNFPSELGTIKGLLSQNHKTPFDHSDKFTLSCNS